MPLGRIDKATSSIVQRWILFVNGDHCACGHSPTEASGEGITWREMVARNGLFDVVVACQTLGSSGPYPRGQRWLQISLRES